MRVKICGIKSEKDIEVLIESDADAAGFLVGQIYPSQDFILPGTASRLAGKLPPYISPVVVTHLREPEAIREIIEKSGIFTIQLHGGSSIDEVKKLREIMPGYVKIILAVHVVKGRVIPNPEEYYTFINAVVLDSYNKEKCLVGGTGTVHNWDVSAEFVKNCRVPVILAGGLSPDNIEEAIKKVRPYGVDANSALRSEKGNRSFELCKKFVEIAKYTAFRIKSSGE